MQPSLFNLSFSLSVSLALFLPPSAKLVIRWADITQLEKSATILLPDAVKVSLVNHINYSACYHRFNVSLSIHTPL